MIYDISITFNCNEITHTLSVPDNTISNPDNLPYHIAEIVKQLIHFSDANPDIIIKDLIDEYGYKDDEE